MRSHKLLRPQVSSCQVTCVVELIFNKLKRLNISNSEPVTPSSSSFNEPLMHNEFMPISKDDARYYNMNHKNRGYCIIFNHNKFNGKSDSREGSTIDVNRLVKTFGNLDFDVKVYENFTCNEIMKVIKEVSQLDHTDNDCLCIITLTHGTRNDRLCARDVVYPSDKLWKPFTADKCGTLAGKPKLFFFQACRGNERDSGASSSASFIQIKETASDTAKAFDRVPIQADFLISYSTVGGYTSWRNPEKGTWYIQSLCDIFDENGTKLDVVTMMTMTTNKVAKFSTINSKKELHNKMQVPEMVHRLRKLICFWPKKEQFRKKSG
ncbi:caspase-1 isoform X3 [Monomorium pharaonis]|uniref:caspase-1 isoform X2 n=1 Tax=Monomorium pharaonis TaxID=307658 RepID=UPI001746F13C|nr:caspase-1 isoform X2 [Monomorium pharaonis]XP_036140797.1 caspase-1 isoform X3 [Monomorium pharaonis]